MAQRQKRLRSDCERARDLVLGQLLSRPETTTRLPDDLLPKNVESLYVTIYIEGRLRGCMGLAIRNLDDDLKKIVEAARDERFSETAAVDADSIAVTVSML